MFVMKRSHKIIKLIDESNQNKEVNRHCFFPIDIGNRMEFEVSKTTLGISLLRGKRQLWNYFERNLRIKTIWPCILKVHWEALLRNIEIDNKSSWIFFFKSNLRVESSIHIKHKISHTLLALSSLTRKKRLRQRF